MYIEDLIEGVNLENYEVEFKGMIFEGENKNDPTKRLEISWLKEIVAFANTNGGRLYIGVDNKTHQILSLDHSTVDKLTLMIHRQIKEHVEPPIRYMISPIKVENNPSRYILMIDVKKTMYPPISLKFNGSASIYVRHFGLTSIATNEEIRNMVLNSEQISYDVPFTEIDFKEEDFKTLYETFFQENNRVLTRKDLVSIGFISIDNKLSKGALLFKDDCNNNQTLVVCTQFLGVSKGANEFYKTQEIKGNLINELKEILNFVESRTANGFIKKDIGRVDLISYPRRSLVEAIVNALAHRNYFISGSQTEVNLYKDRLEIISPGSLVNSKWLKDEKNLASIPPIRRNEVICDTFYILKLMDERGSGFDKIEEDYKPYGDKYAPFASANNQFFSLTLPDLAHKGGLIMYNEFPPISTSEPLKGKHDLKILSFCYNKAKSVSEIASMLKINPSSYFRSNVIERLVNEGYLLAIQDESFSKYFTNHNLVNVE